MAIGPARRYKSLQRICLRPYTKSSLKDVNCLLSDAFSSASLPPHPAMAPSIALEDDFNVASIMQTFHDSNFENLWRQSDAYCIHHAYLCWNAEAHSSEVYSEIFSSYRSTGRIEDAAYLCNILKPETSSWNDLISNYCKCGNASSAFQLFQTMKRVSVAPSCVTFVILLKACSDLEEGKLLHAQAIEYLSTLNVFVKSTLVDVYAKQGSIADAYHMFENMGNRTMVTWSVMIAGFVEGGQNEEAFTIFSRMLGAMVQPTEVTFINILRACMCASNLDNARKIHSAVIENGFGPSLVASNSLMDAYARCGSLEDARHVFNGMRSRNVISWTSLIQGYAQHGHIEDTFELFWQMDQQGVNPNSITLSSILKLCATKELYFCGEQVHNYILMESKENVVFVGNCLLDMYVKYRDMLSAERVFDRMTQRDVISWSTLINGFAQCEKPLKVWIVFKRMLQGGFKPNEVTLLGVLQACSNAGYMEKGRMIHDYIIRASLETHLVVGNALIDMYSKGGNVKAAHEVFYKMSKRDLVTWNSLLYGYCQHGHTIEAFELFKKMSEQPLKLDRFTFLSLLSVCRHCGLVAEGRRYYDIMTKEYRIKPTSEHCACMVDLLGRAGCIHEALELLKKSSIDSVMVWNALLSASKLSRDVDIAEIATKNIMKIDPNNTAACVQLSNIYAALGKNCEDIEEDEFAENQI